MKDPVEINIKAPGYVIIAVLIAILIVGGFSLEPILSLVGGIK